MREAGLQEPVFVVSYIETEKGEYELIQGRNLKDFKYVLIRQLPDVMDSLPQTLSMILDRNRIEKVERSEALFSDLELILFESIKEIPYPSPSSMESYLWDQWSVLGGILEEKILMKIEEERLEGIEGEILRKAVNLLVDECFECYFLQVLTVKTNICLCRSF